MRYRIYYGDGSTYSEDPFFAPNANVQVVAQESISGFGLMHGKDSYYWREDIGWNGCDTAGMWDYLLLSRGPKAVIFGRSIRDEQFWKIVERATKEGVG